MKFHSDFSRLNAPEQDDVIVASSVIKNNGALFWAFRSAAGLAKAVKQSKVKDPVVRTQLDRLTDHLKELGVVQ